MIKIENEPAAEEARRLARGLIATGMSAFAGIPAVVGLPRLLRDVNIELREAKVDSGTSRWDLPYETVEVTYAPSETAGAEHARAINELTRIRTAELADDLTSGAVSQRRETLRIELAAERERISRPLRLGWLPGAKERRRVQRDTLTQRALDTLDDIPLSGPRFDELLAVVLNLVGATHDEPADAEALKRQAVSLHREFQTRRETILMLAWEAIATEDGGADVELNLAGRRDRFTRAKAKARAIEAKAEKERVLAAEEKRQKEIRKKRAEIAREQERCRKWDKMTRPRWNPDHSKLDNEPELGR